MDWTRTEITDLIHFYRQYECLWNTANEDYNNFETKRNAWLQISNACGKEVIDVKRKVKNLRSAYVSEKKKCEASKEQGVNYRPNLFYYNDMDFLSNVLVLRKTTLSPSAGQSFLLSRSGDSDVNIDANMEHKHKTVKVDRKSLRDAKFCSAIDSIVASVEQMQQKTTKVVEQPDEEDDSSNVFNSFGKTTALQLQQLPLDKATEAMAAIFQLVAKKTLDSIQKSKRDVKRKRKNGISFDTMSN